MRSSLVCLVVLVLFAGCASEVSEIPDALRYSKTAAGIPNAAFIHGTNRKDTFPFGDDHTACIMSIDGRTIKDERKRWNEDIPLEPGNRKIEVLYYHAAFITGVTFFLDVAPRKRYELRFAEEKNKGIDFWIVDLATGSPVTDVSRGLLINGAGEGFIPIIIPIK